MCAGSRARLSSYVCDRGQANQCSRGIAGQRAQGRTFLARTAQRRAVSKGSDGSTRVPTGVYNAAVAAGLHSTGIAARHSGSGRYPCTSRGFREPCRRSGHCVLAEAQHATSQQQQQGAQAESRGVACVEQWQCVSAEYKQTDSGAAAVGKGRRGEPEAQCQLGGA